MIIFLSNVTMGVSIVWHYFCLLKMCGYQLLNHLHYIAITKCPSFSSIIYTYVLNVSVFWKTYLLGTGKLLQKKSLQFLNKIFFERLDKVIIKSSCCEVSQQKLFSLGDMDDHHQTDQHAKMVGFQNKVTSHCAHSVLNWHSSNSTSI